ncbi:unnamed protein product [Trichobilharzia regenti]|nr:unnamed protein product [Trichobilharzia regenti]
MLKAGKAAGPDGIPEEALKKDPEASADLMTPLLEKVWKEGKLYFTAVGVQAAMIQDSEPPSLLSSTADSVKSSAMQKKIRRKHFKNDSAVKGLSLKYKFHPV